MSKQKVYITRRFSFESCHHLPNYYGKCSRVHGHSYKLEVTVSANKDFVTESTINPYKNMVIDFSSLKDVVNSTVVSQYDHQDLNEFFDVPTAEVMVVSMFKDIEKKLKELFDDIKLEEVKLWETEDSFASFRGESV